MDKNNPFDRCIIEARKDKRTALKNGDGLAYLGYSAKEYLCKRAKNSLKNKN